MQPRDLAGTEQRDVTKASTILSALSFYFIGVGALYLWGFWDSFSVNVMEYMGLSDVVKVAAWPVLSAFVFLVAGMLMGELMPVRRLPAGGGRETHVGRLLRKLLPVFTWGSILLTSLLIAFGPPAGWQAVAVILGVVLARPVWQLKIFENSIPDFRLRSTAAFAAVVLPLWSFGEGRINANAIKQGHSYQYVLEGSEGVQGMADPLTSMRYVGFAGSTFFFWDPVSTSLTVVPATSVKSLKLRKYRKAGLSVRRWLTTL